MYFTDFLQRKVYLIYLYMDVYTMLFNTNPREASCKKIKLNMVSLRHYLRFLMSILEKIVACFVSFINARECVVIE